MPKIVMDDGFVISWEPRSKKECDELWAQGLNSAPVSSPSLSFVDREREGDDIGAPFTPSAHISSSSFLVYGPHLITQPSSLTILGISPPGLGTDMKSIGSEGRILDA